MKIKLNGETIDTSAKTLQQLIDRELKNNDNIAVACNQKIIAQPNWQTTLLQDGDRIEIVHAIVGG